MGGCLLMLWSGLWQTHKMATLLLAFDALLTLALAFVPSLWSPVGYVLVNSTTCVLSAAVGLEAALRAHMERDAYAACLFAAATPWAALMVLRFIPAGSPFRGMIGVYLGAAAVLGIVAQRAHIEDALARECLWALSATRWMQAIRMALLEVGPGWSAWAGGCASVLWCLWLFMLCRRCVSAAAVSSRLR